jgi:hypothetical protein
MMHALGDRHLFITTKGYIGIACHEIYMCDFVSVLFGGKQPFVLREQQSYLREHGGAPYTSFDFFGAAYACGIMDGEAIGGVNKATHWISFFDKYLALSDYENLKL